MYTGLHVKCPFFVSDFLRQIFEKYSGTKFHEIPSSGSHVVPCGRIDRQTWPNKSSFSQCCELAYHDFSLFMILCVLYRTAELTDNSKKQEIYGLHLPIFPVGAATHSLEVSSAVQILLSKFLVCTIPWKRGKKYSIIASPCSVQWTRPYLSFTSIQCRS
jgi:hypothetical protein